MLLWREVLSVDQVIQLVFHMQFGQFGEATDTDTVDDDLGYCTGAIGCLGKLAARSLVSANPIRIGLLYSNPNSTFFSKMMMGVLDRARQSDTHVVIVTCDEGPEAVGTVTGLIEDGIDGIVPGARIDAIPVQADDVLHGIEAGVSALQGQHTMLFVTAVKDLV